MSDNFIISKNAVKELSSLGGIKFNTPLALCTTFKTGGISDLLIEPYREESLPEIVFILNRERIQLNIIGGGSNLLISDSGLRGATLKISGLDNSFRVEGDTIFAGAALSKERFISDAINAGLGGVEFMAGIPGSIGGGIYMNAGTYMGSFSDILRSITGVNSDGTLFELDVNSDISCYRKMNLPEKCVITGGRFVLARADAVATKKHVDDIISDRWNKHPMEFPSAGSVFKNPEGLSSWKLVNDCGLKGFSIGGAMVSEKHTNFIINTGSASSRDIYNLIRHVQETVYASSGIMLETEIRILGEF